MACKWVETALSRRRQESFTGASTIELQWVGFGEFDSAAAEAALRAVMPMDFELLPLQEWTVTPLGAGNWEASASYSTSEQGDTGEIRFSCDLTGGSTHITHSLATSRYAPSGSTAPDYHGAIGVGRKNEVEGVDITIPEMKFSYSYQMPYTTLTLAYVRILYELTGRVNNNTWKGFTAGELLFLGAQCEESTRGSSSVTYNFAASKNATNIAIGSAITVTSKRGHEYLWVAYEDTEDSSAKKTVARPLAAYVEQVYQYGDFTLLGLGV